MFNRARSFGNSGVHSDRFSAVARVAGCPRRALGPRLAGLAVPVLGLLLGGCSDSGISVADLAMPGLDMATAKPADLTSANPDALTVAFDDQFIGFWGIKAKVASIQTLPVIGDKASTNTILSVGEFKKDMTGKLVMEQRECRVTVTSEVAFIQTDVPDVIADTTPLLTGAVQVYGQAGLLGFRRDQVATGIGCKLTDPVNEAIPTDKADARVFDQDADTKPGVTVLPQSPIKGEVYVTQRRKYSYTNGVQASQTRLTGSIVDRSEQYILDASDPGLKSQVAVKPVDAMSVFEMVKLKSPYLCPQLRTEAATLFTLQ